MPMTIERAMEILSESANVGVTTFNQDFKDAELLGIQALKRLQSYRRDPIHVANIPLPGEIN